MKVCYKYEHTTGSVKYTMTFITKFENWMPLYLGDLVSSVEFIFSTLKQHLKESEKFLNVIFILFYILVQLILYPRHLWKPQDFLGFNFEFY